MSDPARPRDLIWHVCTVIAWASHPGDLLRTIRTQLRKKHPHDRHENS